MSNFLKLRFSDESRLLLPEDYVDYTGNTDYTPTSSAETSEIDNMFCPGKVLHLVERYKLCKSELYNYIILLHTWCTCITLNNLGCFF